MPHADPGQQLGRVSPQPAAAEDRDPCPKQSALHGEGDRLTVAGIPQREDPRFECLILDRMQTEAPGIGQQTFCFKRQQPVGSMGGKSLFQIIQGCLLGRSSL